MNDRLFSTTYAEARSRFVNAANAARAQVYSYALGTGTLDDLFIDVAVVGADNGAPVLIISSGVHGVEGFFGSAVQLSLLERLANAQAQTNVRFVLIHAINPFGFAHIRRVNEDNVDLNRNFMTDGNAYRGAPEGYARLNEFLNPTSPPSRLELFKVKALWKILRIGLKPLKQAIAGGQYAYPRGLFFGGQSPCKSTRIIQANCDAWLVGSQQIMHIDFHTGLGKFANYKLLLSESADSEHFGWYTQTFGPEHVEPLAQPDGLAYRVTGLFGQWMQRHFSDRNYRFVTAEFGTYDVIRVLAALRAENRAHFYSSPGSRICQAAKEELRTCFCPASTPWRDQVVDAGMHIVDQAIHALVSERHAPGGK